MIKVYNTNEVATKTGLSDRSVRRRITNGDVFGPTVMIMNGKQVSYGVTQQGLDNYLKNNKTR